MENQEFVVTLTAENRETGKPQIFRYPISNVGELLNNLIMSGCHNITNVKFSDA